MGCLFMDNKIKSIIAKELDLPIEVIDNLPKINIIGDNEITIENEKMYLEIGQGSDGDYNGGDSKKYCSEDKGNSWNIVN